MNGSKIFLLVPFFLSILVFYTVYKPFTHEPPATITAAICKAAPICFLAVYVLVVNRIESKYPGASFNEFALWISMGLVASSIGDMCLVFKTELFVRGIVFFATAHGLYITGLKRRNHYGVRRYTDVFIVLGGLAASSAWMMAVVVPAYVAFLLWMAFLSVQRHFIESTTASWFGAFGGLCFVVSDSVLGLNEWGVKVPYAELIILTTYYAAQCAIAVSSVDWDQ